MAWIRLYKNTFYSLEELAKSISKEHVVWIEKNYNSYENTCGDRIILDPNLDDITNYMLAFVKLYDDIEVDIPDYVSEPLVFNQMYNGNVNNFILYGLSYREKLTLVVNYKKKIGTGPEVQEKHVKKEKTEPELIFQLGTPQDTPSTTPRSRHASPIKKTPSHLQ